jgi:hypothetical protein
MFLFYWVDSGNVKTELFQQQCLLEKVQEEYIGKVKSIEHEHFVAMEPILARIEVSSSVSVKQTFNTNCALPPSLSLSLAFF